MTRSFTATVELPGSVEAAYEVLTGPQWPAALDARLHDDSRLVRAEPTAGGGTVVEVSRRLPDQVPSAVKGFLPKDGRITQTDTWAPADGGARRGTWTGAFPGAPGSIGGTTALEPTADGCRWTVHGDLTIKVPLVGGRVEGFVAPLLEKLVHNQGEALRDALAGTS